MPLEKAPFDEYISLCLRVVGLIGISRQVGRSTPVPIRMFIIRSSTNPWAVPREPYSAQVPKRVESFGLLGHPVLYPGGGCLWRLLILRGWVHEGERDHGLDPGEKQADKLCFDIVAHLPQEEVVALITVLPIIRSEGLCIQMCNLTRLQLQCVDPST
jgi:hypothetical protein